MWRFVSLMTLEGNVLKTCRPVTYEGWSLSPQRIETTCAVACRSWGQDAMCVDSEVQVACAYVVDDSPGCFGDLITTCRDGFPTKTEAPCADGLVCGDGRCVIGPDSRCDESNRFCDLGNVLVECSRGYIIKRTSCGPSRFCSFGDCI
jgi:hypothetical protein